MLDFYNLDKMITEKLISVQKHPALDLYIYNYTQRAAFDRVWNNETLQCRGLIMDGNRNIVSRPFSKFFNFGELDQYDATELKLAIENSAVEFTVTEKMDGSLGISYFDPDGKMYIATRGSFVSEQAKKANLILAEKYPKLAKTSIPELTFLFEILYPQNRIVVNYGDREELVLLSVLVTESGEEFDRDWLEIEAGNWGIPLVPQFDGITDFTKIEQRPNSEGYVVHFPATGLRFKLKFDEYVRLHRILTGINAKRIWEILSAGNSLDEILDRVPDEFYAWVKKTQERLEYDFRALEIIAQNIHKGAKHLETRKDQAAFIMAETKYPGIVFNMLDGKDYRPQIWKILEPKYETPFKVDEL